MYSQLIYGFSKLRLPAVGGWSEGKDTGAGNSNDGGDVDAG